MEVMKALYPPEGGRPKAFVCMEAAPDYPWCGKVTRTQRGMWMHLRRKHNVKKQADFVWEPKPADTNFEKVPTGFN